MAVLVVQVDVGFALLSVFDRVKQRTVAAAQDRAVVVAVHQDLVLAAVPEDLLGAEAGDLLRAFVPVQDPALAIDEIDAVAQILEHRQAHPIAEPGLPNIESGAHHSDYRHQEPCS